MRMRSPAVRSRMMFGAVLIVTCVSVAAAQDGTTFPLPPGVHWVPNPMIPPGGQLAVLVGALPAKGPYAARIGFSADLKVPPHTHPEDRIYTVLSGTWFIGLGDTFDPAQLTAFPTGAVYLVPANTPHFHWAREGPTVVQINGIGPSATVYVNPADVSRTPRR
jgi:quercetin dioxygenase-like cupin family protein